MKKRSFKALEQEMLKNGLLLTEENLKSISGGKTASQEHNPAGVVADPFTNTDTTIVQEGSLSQNAAMSHSAGSVAQSFVHRGLMTPMGQTEDPLYTTQAQTTMTPLPNGYCVCNEVSEALYGNTDHAQEIFDYITANYPEKIHYIKDNNGAIMYDSNGNARISSISTDSTMYTHLWALNPAKNATKIDVPSMQPNTVTGVIALGATVYAVIDTVYNGESATHAVIITGTDDNGNWKYTDPTNNNSPGVYSKGNWIESAYAATTYVPPLIPIIP